MATFRDWCEHYGYDPESDSAHADYQRYCDNLGLLNAIAAEGDAMTTEATINGREISYWIENLVLDAKIRFSYNGETYSIDIIESKYHSVSHEPIVTEDTERAAKALGFDLSAGFEYELSKSLEASGIAAEITKLVPIENRFKVSSSGNEIEAPIVINGKNARAILSYRGEDEIVVDLGIENCDGNWSKPIIIDPKNKSFLSSDDNLKDNSFSSQEQAFTELEKAGVFWCADRLLKNHA